MGFRVFGIVCAVIGHKRAKDSRRNVNGSIFATCSVCARELFREPVRGRWRVATDQDRMSRGFALTEPTSDIADAPKRSRRSRR